MRERESKKESERERATRLKGEGSDVPRHVGAHEI